VNPPKQHKEQHYVNRSGWLRAAILGANDGILSTASLVIGVAAASQTREPIVIAGVAGIVAGALSMAAGEYVSVSSQSEIELRELSDIYESRGLSKDLALEVAKELTAYDALGAHARDELGINEITQAKPLQAAFASGMAFIVGGILPVLVSLWAALTFMIYLQYAFALVFLILLGAASAKTGGSSVVKAVLRISFWGTIAMGATALIGYIFGVSVG
jgi:VIT1/CCC1 family predicted Fe2+/Mn2+ transporter